VQRKKSDGPGITDVTLTTRSGDITLNRPDGRLATLSVPGAPDRPVALRRRDVPELLSEELRRLDPDDIYAATVKRLAKMSAGGGTSKPAKKAAKKAASRKRPAAAGAGTAPAGEGDSEESA
jgi:glucose-6-phosphate dehydrogenase assembly protein OpcA